MFAVSIEYIIFTWMDLLIAEMYKAIAKKGEVMLLLFL